MVVYKCEDPVRVVLHLQDSSGQHCNRTYIVSGDASYDEISLGNVLLHASHSRNTSHLHFLVSFCRLCEMMCRLCGWFVFAYDVVGFYIICNYIVFQGKT